MLNVVKHREDVEIIQVFSTLNEWIDCIFLVNKADKEKATKLLIDKFDEWCEKEEAQDEPYGEWLSRALYEADIYFEVYYKGGE